MTWRCPPLGEVAGCRVTEGVEEDWRESFEVSFSRCEKLGPSLTWFFLVTLAGSSLLCDASFGFEGASRLR